MALDMEAALQEVVDRSAIHDVMMRYVHGIDRRDWDLVATCFAPDADLDYEDFYQGTPPKFIAAVRDAFEQYFAVTMHHVGNQLIEVEGGKGRMESYAVAYHREKEPRADGKQRDIIVGVRYLDELERRDGRGVIVRRSEVYDWRKEEVVQLPTLR